MKNLTQIMYNMKDIVESLEDLLKQESQNLRNPKDEIDKFNQIVQKKISLFQKFSDLHKKKIVIEKQYKIFPPYEKNKKIQNIWKIITSKSIILKKINAKNKLYLNYKMYLNQNFLELFSVYKKNITYNSNGYLNNNIKNKFL